MMISSIGKLVTAIALAGVVTVACANQNMRERFKQRMAERRAAAATQDRLPRAGGRMQPVVLPNGAQLERDVAYGPDPEQRMDVYRPANARNAPVILMVHGGGWSRGDKEAANVVNNKVAHWLPKGYIVVSVGYRMVPRVTPLGEVDDVARALAFAQNKGPAWGGDPNRIVMMGHSAGAHLVSLMSADRSIATRAGAGSWLGTVALDSAAYNVAEIMEQRHYPLYDKAFGSDRQLWRDASPTLRLTHAPVPMLLVCSSRRDNSCAQASAFAAKATSLGGRVKVVPVDLGHADINAQVGTPGSLTATVDAFLQTLELP
jgi:acetyl esterase/lipase